ncbi:MAG TPA: TolC family protein, partial [Vicinamibacterales bacterium]|nr:TolC family protein [Vicinamibacterales bacterium]
EDLRQFREVVPFRHLTVLANEGVLAAVPELAANIRGDVAALDLKLTLVRVGRSVDAALAEIPPTADAVYVLPLIQLLPGDFDRLVKELIRRRLPAFSYWGRSEIDRGLLASTYLDTDFRRMGRRIALNLQRIVHGEEPGSIPVDFRRERRLTLNMSTARAIGVHPRWSIITEAEILHDARLGIQRRLDLATAAREVVVQNLDVLAADRFVAAGAQTIREARSALYPQLSISGRMQVIDADRAGASLGSQPQRLYLGSAGVSQLIYSDAALANVDIQEHLQASREQTREQTRLDVVFEGAVAYLNVLRAKTFERIERTNLNVTRSNLELAQARQRVGAARPAEVIRWENQIANNRRDVIRANAQRNLAEIELNRLLHRPLEEPFETAEASLSDPAMLTTAAQLEPYMDNPTAFDIFRDFMTGEGLALSPELRQLDAVILAQQRTVVAAERAFWAPTVAVQGDVTGIEPGGAGSGGFGTGLPIALSRANRINWTIGLAASVPLFTGGARRAELARAREQLDEQLLDRRAAAERVEQRIRSALHLAGSAYAGIELARTAAGAARRNLELVSDAYERGALPILDLLDAQNAALVAEQAAANAAYDYLIDLMNVQRAVGRFDFFMTPDEYRDFLARLKAFFSAAGYQRRSAPSQGDDGAVRP